MKSSTMKRILYALVVISLCLQCWSLTPAQTQQPTPTPDPREAVANKAFDEGLTLLKQGTAESLRAALVRYEIASRIFRETGNRLSEAISLLGIGRVYDSLSERQPALTYYNQALPLLRAVGHKRGEATALTNMGAVHYLLGEPQKALENYNQALPLFMAVGDKNGEATTLDNIGMVYAGLGDRQKALEYYNQALPLRKVVGDRGGEATTLSNFGAVYADLGERQKALEYFNQTLALNRAVGDRSAEAATLNNIGMIYSALGEQQKALGYYNQVLPLRKAVGDRNGEATTLDNIGMVYAGLGDRRKALEYYNQALPILRAVGDRIQEATTLNNIGMAYYSLGEQPKALEYYIQSLTIYRATGSKNGEAMTLVNIGLIFYLVSEKQKALEYYNQALSLFRAVGNKNGEATTLVNISGVYYDTGEQQKALENYNQALPLYRAVGDRHGEEALLCNLMWYWKEQRNARFAIYYGKQAINILQQLRANIQGLEKETQQAFLKSVEAKYRYLADVLIAQGRIPEAEQVLAMLKDEELFQFVRRSGEVAERLRQRTDLNELEAKALSEYTKYSDRLTEIGSRLGELDKERLKFPPDKFPQQAEYDQLKLQLEDAKRVFIVFLRQLADEFGKSNEKVKQIESSLQADLKRWGANNVAIISTIAGEERLNLILTTSAIQKAYTIELKAVALNKLVQEFRAVVNDPSTKYDPRPLGQKLYDVLIKPLEKDLVGAKADTLLWSLDGTLRYVPTAALWDGKQYLAERYRNVIITLASRSKIGEALAGNKADWQALGAGVSTKWPGFAELTGVPEELRSIVRETSTHNPAEEKGVLTGQRLLNGQFNLASFERALGRYRLIHIASHFRFRPGNETNSFLLLGDGSSLTVDKVRAAGSMFDGVELLALSACDTATGGTGANGAEVESFGVIAQEQGAKAVMGTLWPVADVSTRDLMVAFYNAYSTNPNLNKSEALRQAQLLLLHGTQTQAVSTGGDARAHIVAPANSTQPLFQKDPAKPFAHPYYWAPFVLIGNWR